MKIVVFGSECKADKLPVIKGLFDKLASLGAEVFVQQSYSEFLKTVLGYVPDTVSTVAESAVDESFDMALSVGGDGAFLRTAMHINRRNIPILGINTGHLGFLADVSGNQIDETLEELFSHEYRIEERTLLQLQGYEHGFGGYNFALNEIAVLKRETSSMLTIHAYMDDVYLNTYVADGLLIATPTGSTAYSMSVNGPILLPHNRNFVISPVAPHSLNVRPIVIPDEAKFSLMVESRTESFLVAVDGRSEDVSAGNSLIISKANFTVKLIKRFNQTFMQTLREKLMWGADPRS
ncbi:MAG: NAD kinase [Tannerella sp.]|jgi:NAD+ kinase|nr:NAD kinase [Tannerella sp.]